MTDILLKMGKCLIGLIPFILLALVNMKANLKKIHRSKQLLMPVLALLFCIIVLLTMDSINDGITGFIESLPAWFDSLAEKTAAKFNGKLNAIAELFAGIAVLIRNMLRKINFYVILFFFDNMLFMLAFITFKGICLAILSTLCAAFKDLYEKIASLFYDKEENGGKSVFYLSNHMGQARTFLKTLYFASLILSCIVMGVSFCIYRNGNLQGLFYPVFGLILIGELYFCIDGLTKEESKTKFEKVGTEEVDSVDFRKIRRALKHLFGDKLDADDTLVTVGDERIKTNDEILSELEADEDMQIETYGRFMRKKLAAGLDLDQNYLKSGKEMLCGKSILFNNPFYYDLIPYIFYPMNHTLLRHKKVAIVLGRHDTQDDIENWCLDGLTAVTGIRPMWNVGVLCENPEVAPDVGIITRSDVHNLKMHEQNREFFSEVEFIVLIEPSKLVTTAQVGLNSIIRYCRGDGKNIVYCSTDKNCDGLLDALSHILMTSLTEVSATNRNSGISSYMCWAPGDVHFQHRILPNVARYLGAGTELSFVGLRNRVAHADWYGGDAFPVTDMHWVASQYYYPLLNYAGRPAVQEGMDTYFNVSPNMWNAKIEDNHYMTVEDESYNMFEVRRDFSTRAKKQGFVNIISPAYLLKDYMTDNNGLFSTDPKAIPYIVADYAHTERNVIFRLCLRMCCGTVNESEILRELMLIGVSDVQSPAESLWHMLASCYYADDIPHDELNREYIEADYKGRTLRFTYEVITVKRKYSVETGKMENVYSIKDTKFSTAILGDLRSASYIAENENGEKLYLGTELGGHIYQKHLPGQFFTLGGKYYEMLRVTDDGQVLLRRASDHITNRPGYRQIREYSISDVKDSQIMGDSMDVYGMHVTKQIATVKVNTPSYWEMPDNNDFFRGHKVSVNGIPERCYYSKQLLKIQLPESPELTPQIRRTITLLMNEVFTTLFAENKGYICAVTPGETVKEQTYSLLGDYENENFIYIIEDSQLDIGLLEAVRRNLKRIFSIVCDYLEWHLETLDLSLNPPPEPPVPEFTIPEGESQEKKKGFKAFLKRILGFFKKIFKAIAEFFKKLFGKKKKDNPPKTPDVPGTDSPAGSPTDGDEPNGDGDIPAEETEPDKNDTVESDNSGETPTDDETDNKTDEGTDAESDEAQAAEEKPQETDNAEESATSEDESGAGTTQGNGDEEDKSFFALMSAAPTENSDTTDENGDDTDGEEPQVPTTVTEVDGDTVEFEPEQVEKPTHIIERLPYHQRYYLLYGGSEMPEGIDVVGTLEFIKSLGFDNGALKRARDGKSIAATIEKTFVPNKSGTKYCDFCGAELIGDEYERLGDGRERCISCGKTSIKTADEFEAIYKEVHSNMETFFTADINVPITVQMVNAKKLHKKLNRKFVPTGNYDGRVLGVAIKSRNSYSILIENGAPRLQSIMTMAHELTHIWQYINWDAEEIVKKYGKEAELEVYEGMAKWAEIQYAYLIREPETAKREEIITRTRDDEYGRGFIKYSQVYKLSESGSLTAKKTPFVNVHKPL